MEHNMELLRMENDRLEKKLYFKEKELKGLQTELTAAQNTIDELTAKNAELQRLLNEQQSSLPHTTVKPPTGAEFRAMLSVYTKNDSIIDVKGLESEWGDVMVAFSDPIFWEQNVPDVVLFRDDIKRCFRTLDGNVSLTYPISQKMLDDLGWEHVRSVTQEESEKIIKDYKL